MSKVVWTISSENSRIYIKLKWLRISQLAGYLTRISGEVHADRFFTNPEVYLFIEAGSLNTQYPEQNDRLKGQKMLDAEKYPFLEFSSIEGCQLRSGSIWELPGVMTIKESKYPLTMIINKSDITLNRKKNTARFRLFGELNLEKSDFYCTAENDYGRVVTIEAEISLKVKE
ncbi:MAG TPA: YceI family protein [Puia sp.]|nr:YceI family protein [Puia sp.]